MIPAAHHCLVKPVGGGAVGPGSEIGGGGQTIGTIWQIPEHAVWIRFRFACWSPADVPVENACYSPTSQIGDAHAAYDEANAPASANWRPITFKPAGQAAKLLDQLLTPGEDHYSFTLPSLRGVSPADFAPQPVCSNWLPFTPLARTDGAEALVAVRLYVPQGVPAYRLGHAAAPAAALGFHISGTYSFGNHAVAPFGGTPHAYPVTALHGIDLICARPTRSLIVAGDSIASGDSTTGAATTYGLAAARSLTRLGHPTTAALLANPGQTTASFIANAYAYLREDIAALRGTPIVIQCWSGNDPPGRDPAQANFAIALAFASFCRCHGLSPILATGAPVCPHAPDYEAGRTHANSLARNAGLPCLDIDRITGAGATPNTYKPGFAAWDNVHLADAGQLAVAEVLAGMIMEKEPPAAGAERPRTP